MRPQTYQNNAYNSYYEIQLILYMNDHQQISPDNIRTNLFRQDIFRYINIQFYLRKWDYRIDMIFDNKNSRQNAIDQIKKLKIRYGVAYHYDLKKNPKNSRFLMDKRQYYKAIDDALRTKNNIKLQKKYSNLEHQQESENMNYKQYENQIPQQEQPKIIEQTAQQIKKQRQQKIRNIFKNNDLLTKLIDYELKIANRNPPPNILHN